MAAFLPGGPYARILAEHVLILVLDDNVFVHGGVLPSHVAYGIGRINREAKDWIAGKAERPTILEGSDSPQWTRLYSQEPDSLACDILAQVLERLDAKRMVMGHTIQGDGIAGACDGQAWGIDVGMAEHYGGSAEVLEIIGDSVRVLRVKKSEGQAPSPVRP